MNLRDGEEWYRLGASQIERSDLNGAIEILVPLMVANMLSFVISKRYQPVPVYHALLNQDGIHLPSPVSRSLRPLTSARSVMQSRVSLTPPDTFVEGAMLLSAETGSPALLIGTAGRFLVW